MLNYYSMKAIFYSILVTLSKLLGPAVFILFSRIVAAGYFFLFPKRVAVSVSFYRRLFPDKSRWRHIYYAWRQYHQFTYVFLDRFLLSEYGDIKFTSEGWEYLEEAVKNKTGGILLMSHIGNWEVAAHLLKQKAATVAILFYMGTKRKEQIEQLQKRSLIQSGIQIIATDKNSGSPTDILESIRFLKNGGLVSMTGDVLWQENQRKTAVQFLNQTVFLPEIPYILGLLSGSPIFVFFSFRTGYKRYAFSIEKPFYVQASSKVLRQNAIRKSAQKYADILEQTIRKFPCEWFHFEEMKRR